MKKFIGSIIFFLLVMTESISLGASSNPPFAATCQDVLAHGYRDGTDLHGKSLGESWTNDEHFNSTWKFIYKGDDQIIIDNKKGIIVLEHPGVLIAIEGGSNGFASGVWSYAIHLGMKKVVASQVNAFGSLDDTTTQGVKARSVNLNCTFAFNTAQLPTRATNWEDLVNQAQTRLKTLGLYQGPVDGNLNPQTKLALKAFQIVEGLPESGELDVSTRKALYIE